MSLKSFVSRTTATTRHWPSALLLVLVGCSSSSSASDGSASSDGGATGDVDLSPPDGASDAATADVSTDGGAVDAALDVMAPDGAEAGSKNEGGAEAGRDAGSPLDVCQGGTMGVASDAGTAHVQGYGSLELDSPATDPIVAMRTTLLVPPQPPASGTVFLWPGLQPLPAGANYLPIDNGVLQPVLTWGPTCAPNAPASSYASWWVSAQYVNTVGSAPGYTGCQGGTGMDVAVGHALDMTFKLTGTTWSQDVTDLQTGQTVTYSIDLQGQAQGRALFVIEGYSQEPTVPVHFQSTVITFATPPGSCQPVSLGATDTFTAPVTSADGTRCCISDISLRPQGI